jgi:PAS domain S-box-containing protein
MGTLPDTLGVLRPGDELTRTGQGSGEGVDALMSLEQSERRFRMLTQNMSDVVYEVGADGRLRWVSESVERMLGWRPEELVGICATDLVAQDDRDAVLALRQNTLHGVSVAGRFRVRTKSGESHWFDAHAHPIVLPDGSLDGNVVGLADAQAQVVLGRAVTSLALANEVLLHATTEDQLITDMCNVVVEKAGYLFAWYGRPVDDAERTVQPTAWSDGQADYVDGLHISWGDDEFGHGPTGRCIRTRTPQIVSDFKDDEHYLPWLSRALDRGFRSSVSLPVLIDGEVDGALMVYAGEGRAFDDTSLAVLDDMAAHIGIGIRKLRDAAALVAAHEQERLLRNAIDQAAESILVTDRHLRILYANPAATRITGFTADELIGHTPELLHSGLHDRSYFDAIEARLASGGTWRGVIINRRKSGELYEEDTTVSPVLDDGDMVACTIVKRDLSTAHGIDDFPSRARSDREVVNEILRYVRPADEIHVTAASLCHAARRLDEIDGAMVILLHENGEIVPVAIDGIAVSGQEVGTPMSYSGVEAMVQLSAVAPWWMDLRDLDGPAGVNPELTRSMIDAGITATAYAPIRWDGRLLGVLALATSAPGAAAWMPSRLPVFEELASFGGMMLGAQASRHRRAENLRNELRDIIDHTRFHTIFEPVIDLASGQPVGFEALTRFDDGYRPDRRFADADAVGLESELETACARSALLAARSLPEGTWVSVNFSPRALLDGRAGAVVRESTRPVVVEITEHMAIENYRAVRRALDQCGSVRLAVDDAGAGFASLRHILELQPDLIKLDIGLVRDIDTDPARQALVAGMRHFAALTGATLIAEGVETTEQADTVGRLGVEFAQGHLFAPVGPFSLD